MTQLMGIQKTAVTRTTATENMIEQVWLSGNLQNVIFKTAILTDNVVLEKPQGLGHIYLLDDVPEALHHILYGLFAYALKEIAA